MIAVVKPAHWGRFFASHFPFLIVLLLAVIVCWHNYTPGTFLSGWDTLQPEWNLGQYAQRVFFGAWQEHQGLGAPASQAHLAELPRLPLLWILQAALPLSAVRYTFFFLMFLSGGIGVYCYVYNAFLCSTEKPPTQTWPAALAAAFFMFNIGTMQHFVVPLEMFAVHFATVGFIFLTVHQVVKHGRSRDYWWFFVVQVLSAPTAHTSTLFYMVATLILAHAFSLTLLTHINNPLKGLTRLGFLLALMLIAHSYWILPNMYYIFQHSNYVREAKISRLFSPEAFWQNQAFGQLTDVITFKNFLFHWKVFDFPSNSFIPLLQVWNDHLKTATTQAMLWFVTATWLSGIVFSILKKKTRVASLSLLPVFLISAFFLINQNFPFFEIFATLRKGSQLFEESLRFPFTKFSIVFIFCASVFLAVAVDSLLALTTSLTKVKFHLKGVQCVSGIFFVSILYVVWPFFSGNLISPAMRVHIPSRYVELRDWFSTKDPNSRVALFPITYFWGWEYYDWSNAQRHQGYQGAGFAWFLIPQPILEREFDRWIPTNENFYTQVAEVVRKQDSIAFQELLKKYHVNWLVYDHSIFDPQRLDSEDYNTEFKSLIVNNQNISLLKTFDSIEVYQVHSAAQSPIGTASAESIDNDKDNSRTFLENGNEYIYRRKNNTVAYPFDGLLKEQLFGTKVTDNVLSAEWTSPSGSSEFYKVSFPSWSKYYNTVPISVSTAYNLDKQELSIVFVPAITSVSFGSQSLSLYPDTVVPSHIVKISAKKDKQLFIQNGNSVIPLNNSDSPQLNGTINFNINGGFSVSILEKRQSKSSNDALFTEIEKVEFSEDEVRQFIPAPKNEISIQKFSSAMTQFSLGEYFFNHISFGFQKESTVKNCQEDMVGSVHVKKLANSYEYTSSGSGVACESFFFSPSASDLDQVLTVSGENKNGKGMKLYISSPDKKVPYIEEIFDVGINRKIFSILKPENRNGILLQVESSSYGSTPTVNTVNNISIVSLPLQWLANIKVSGLETQTNLLHIVSWNRLFSGGYTASVVAEKNDSLLTFSQSYDDAWIAFDWQNPRQRFEHVQYNGWANAWVVPRGEHHIVMLFWPQLLAFLGYGVLIITFVVLTLKLIFIEKKPKKDKIKALVRQVFTPRRLVLQSKLTSKY